MTAFLPRSSQLGRPAFRLMGALVVVRAVLALLPAARTRKPMAFIIRPSVRFPSFRLPPIPTTKESRQ